MPTTKLPNSVHAMKGTLQPCRHAGYADEDPVLNTFPEPPEALDAMALEVWNEVRISMESTGLIRSSDRYTLAVYCSLVVKWKIEGADMASSHLGMLHKYGSSLYLDSAARAKIPAPIEGKEKNDFADFQ